MNGRTPPSRRWAGYHCSTGPTAARISGELIIRRTLGDDRGFTLIEVMVALLVFAMIAAAGVAVLAFSVRAQSATTVRLDDLAALDRTVSILSADLAQARDRPPRDEAGTAGPAFVGDASGAMRFVRAGWSNVDAAPRPSLQKLAYRLDGGAWQRIAYPLVDGAAPLAPVPLLARVAGVRARYRFRGAWSDGWDGRGGAALPDAVELTITRADRTGYRLLLPVGTGYAPVPQPSATPDAPA